VLERLKHEVLNIFGLMTTETLMESYSECAGHLRVLGECSLLQLMEEESNGNEQEEVETRPRRSKVGVSTRATSDGQQWYQERDAKELYAKIIKKIYSEIKR